jgi:hypothetical protein
LPFVGGWLDQRADPKGVGPRAEVANIGSQKLHDRSGAAVPAAEFPRLKPFIPGTDDRAEAIITKLEKMKEVMANETAAMRAAGTPSARKPPGGSADPEFDALMASIRPKKP